MHHIRAIRTCEEESDLSLVRHPERIVTGERTKCREEEMQVRPGGKLFLLALAETLLCLAAGTLAAQDVRYNYMPGTDFLKYHT